MHDDGSRGLEVRIPHGGAVDGAQVPLAQADQRSRWGVPDLKRLMGKVFSTGIRPRRTSLIRCVAHRTGPRQQPDQRFPLVSVSVVGATGFEPVTSSVSDPASYYRPVCRRDNGS